MFCSELRLKTSTMELIKLIQDIKSNACQSHQLTKKEISSCPPAPVATFALACGADPQDLHRFLKSHKRISSHPVESIFAQAAMFQKLCKTVVY